MGLCGVMDGPYRKREQSSISRFHVRTPEEASKAFMNKTTGYPGRLIPETVGQ